MLKSDMHSSLFSGLSLMEFVTKGDSCALKREQIITERKAEDAERYVRREEDKKYNIILINRR
jgi:hypothetical protein